MQSHIARPYLILLLQSISHMHRELLPRVGLIFELRGSLFLGQSCPPCLHEVKGCSHGGLQEPPARSFASLSGIVVLSVVCS